MKQRITRMNRVTSKQLYKRRTGWVVATAAAGAILGVSGVSVAHADTVTAKGASSVSSVTKQKDNTQSKAVILKSSSVAKSSVATNNSAMQSNAAAKSSSSVAKPNASSMSRADAKRAMNDAALNLAQAKQAAQQSAAKLAQVRAQFASQNGATNGTQSTQNSDNTAGPLANVPSSSVQGTTPLVDAGEINAQGYEDIQPNYEIIEYVDASGKVIAVKRIEDDTNPAETTSSNGELTADPSLSTDAIVANAPQGYEVVKASSGVLAGQVVDEAQLKSPNDVTVDGTAINPNTRVVTDVYLVKPTGSADPSTFTEVKPLIYYGDKNTAGNQVSAALGNANYDWTRAKNDAQAYLNGMADGTNPDAVQAEKSGQYQVVTSGPAALNAPFSDHVTGANGETGPNYQIVQYVTADGTVVATKKLPDPNNIKPLSSPNAPGAVYPTEVNDEAVANVPAGYELVGYQNLPFSEGIMSQGDSVSYGGGSHGVNVRVWLVKKIGAPDPTSVTKVAAKPYYGNADTPDSQLANALGNPNFGKSSSTSGSTGSSTSTKPSGNTGSTAPAKPSTSGNTGSSSAPSGLTPSGSHQVDTGNQSGNTGSTTNTPATKPSGNTGSTTNTPASKPSDNTGSTTNTPASKPSDNTGSTSVTPSVKPSTDTPAAQPSQPSANQPSADKPATDQPSAVKPSAQQPSANKPSASQPAQPNQPAANTKGHATQGTLVAPLANQQASSAVDVVFPPQFKETAVSANAMRRSRVASQMDGQGELANNESQALRRSHKRTLPDTGDAQGVGLIGLGLAALMTAFGLARPARKH